jgi:hypothetical protein
VQHCASRRARAPTALHSRPCPFNARSISNKLRAELGGASHKVKKPWTRKKYNSQRRKWEVGVRVDMAASSAADHATAHAAGSGRL